MSESKSGSGSESGTFLMLGGVGERVGEREDGRGKDSGALPVLGGVKWSGRENRSRLESSM